MDSQSQASFIPKKPLISAAVASRPHTGLLWVLSLIIFVASVVASGAAFAYQIYLQNAIQSSSASLAAAQAAYDPSVIEDIVRLDNRINAATTLLANHLSPSAVFTFLENNTLQNVRFSDFSYSFGADGSAILTLSGEALDFPSVALQSDAFSQSRALKDVLFSDINIDPSTGHVVFKVTGIIDPSLILYANSLALQQSSATPLSGIATSSSAGAAPSSSSATTPVQGGAGIPSSLLGGSK